MRPSRDRTLERDAAFVAGYAIVDVVSAFVTRQVACDGCAGDALAHHKLALIIAFGVDLVIVACAYFGYRGKLWAFVLAALILCGRLAFAVTGAEYFTFLVVLFFAFWPLDGAVRCLRRDRENAIRRSIEALHAMKRDEKEPPPWGAASR